MFAAANADAKHSFLPGNPDRSNIAQSPAPGAVGAPPQEALENSSGELTQLAEILGIVALFRPCLKRCALLCAIGSFAFDGWAQTYPARSVRFVVPFSSERHRHYRAPMSKD
jgi:hypothetical protein